MYPSYRAAGAILESIRPADAIDLPGLHALAARAEAAFAPDGDVLLVAVDDGGRALG